MCANMDGMSEIIISGPAKLWIAPADARTPNEGESFEDVGWQLVEEWKWVDDVVELGKPTEPFKPPAYNYRQLAGITITMTFMVVGGSLPYRRRQSFLNLARYTRWPYTN